MKIRNGFVSNSSSSSFVITTTVSHLETKPMPSGNPHRAWKWLKAMSELPCDLGLALFLNGNRVCLRFEADPDCYKNDIVIEFDHLDDNIHEWTYGEFLEEFKNGSFEIRNAKEK